MGHIQIRDVPDDVHRKLKARAAERGMSLSEYLLSEIRTIAGTPTIEELVQRVRSKRLYNVDPAAIIRRDRDRR